MTNFKELPKSFPGATVNKMPNLEKCFNIKIMMYNLNRKGKVLYDSLNDSINIIYLNVYQEHLSYMCDFKKYAKNYVCIKCTNFFSKIWNLKQHIANCYDRTKYLFPGRFYRSQDTIFDKLELLYISKDDNDNYYPQFMVWNMEAVLKKSSTTDQLTDKLKLLSKQIATGVSISSNVQGYTYSKFIVDLSTNNLISQLMNYLTIIS